MSDPSAQPENLQPDDDVQGTEQPTASAGGDTPSSFYQLPEMNQVAKDLKSVPSQYQLESLSEVYVFDIPTMADTPSSQPQATSAANSLPPFMPSEYLSEQMN